MNRPVAVVKAVNLHKTVTLEGINDSSSLTVHAIMDNGEFAREMDIPLTSFGCVCTHEAMLDFVRRSLQPAVDKEGLACDMSDAMIVIPVGISENIKNR